MNEDEFRTTYHSLNPNRCVYEKSIFTQSCDCQHSTRINIAERVGIGCTNDSARRLCDEFLTHLRQQAGFALKMTNIVGNLLPHSKEVQVQKGGLAGLVPGLPNTREAAIKSIFDLIEAAAKSCDNDLSRYPYQQLIPSISHHVVAKRVRRKDRQ